MEEESITSAAN